MKTIFFIVAILYTLNCYSQTDIIGISKNQLLNTIKSNPCKTDYNSVWYCYDNGKMVNYQFMYEKVSIVTTMNEFESEYLARQNVLKEINNYKLTYGKPEMKGDEAYFFSGRNLIMLAYGYSNGKHYSCMRVSQVQ
jgi:hypothetical protein